MPSLKRPSAGPMKSMKAARRSKPDERLSPSSLRKILPNTLLYENLATLGTRFGEANMKAVTFNMKAFGCCLGLCSLCSGTNMLPLVALTVSVIACVPLKLVDHYSSENVRSKQMFGKFITQATCTGASQSHTFDDMTKLLDVEARVCVNHPGQKCALPGPDAEPRPFLSSVGFSCKDFSNLHRKYGLPMGT